MAGPRGGVAAGAEAAAEAMRAVERHMTALSITLPFPRASGQPCINPWSESQLAWLEDHEQQALLDTVLETCLPGEVWVVSPRCDRTFRFLMTWCSS